MEKIAIISDIHGNLEALKTVLSDIKKRNISKIYCLGDIIAKGVHAHECIQLIKDNCEVVIQGNTDEYFSGDFTEEELLLKPDASASRVKWNQSLLTDEDKTYLQSLPYCYEFFLSGRLVRLLHATPNKIDDFLGHIDKLEHYFELLKPSDKTISNEIADIVICGHSHMQELEKMYNRTIIKTGSVGNPIDVFRNDDKDAGYRNTTVCNYVVITGSFGKEFNDISYEYVSIPYDIEKELSSDNIFEREDYESEIRYGKYRDMKKVYKSFQNRGIDIDKI